MKRIVTILLVVMTGAFGALLYIQRDVEAEPAKPVTKPTPTIAELAKPPALKRTLRTVALGWEWLAPGVIANDGGTAGTASAYKTAGLDASFSNASSVDDIASALAKGGGEAGGADIAILPLASYVASYERLRALSPEIVFVVGWSRGREAMFGGDQAALTKLPATGQIKLVAQPAQPETFLALFVMDLAGVQASRVEVVDKDPKALTAVFRNGKPKPPGKLLITSADTPRLMPIVAVAPHGFVEAHTAELETWGKVWLTGVKRLDADVPAGGRQVAAISGAPPVLQIIEALGQVEFASLRENAGALGLSGRGAVTLDQIFKTTWRIWRDNGVITTPPPEAVPLSTAMVASLVRADPTAVADSPRPRTASDDAKRPEVLLVVRATPGKDPSKLDAESFVTQIGWLAGVFDRLPLRIDVRDDAKTAQLLAEMARDRYGLRPAQLSSAKKPPAGTLGAVEVLSTN
jgi:hypothetical protein